MDRLFVSTSFNVLNLMTLFQFCIHFQASSSLLVLGGFFFKYINLFLGPWHV